MEPTKNKIPKWLVPGMLLVSFLGFLDSLYLTIQHYSGEEITCNIVHGCEIVTNSVYSMIGPVPVALLGVLYYLAIMLAVLIYWDTGRIKIMKLAGLMTTAGFVMSLYFLAIQAFVLNAFCQYCLVSAMTSTVLFILGMNAVSKIRKMV
ncbi:vitamin K epoxide reductase family protein [Candidatus Uhrbacteria bacterium]|nr:vitamin K epoxide reductase family protein [Candidatus Uhrbacteria bacterium]